MLGVLAEGLKKVEDWIEKTFGSPNIDEEIEKLFMENQNEEEFESAIMETEENKKDELIKDIKECESRDDDEWYYEFVYGFMNIPYWGPYWVLFLDDD
jgi:hypothetical protein